MAAAEASKEQLLEEIMWAGFGGQGIMTAGKILAYAGMKEGLEVAWIPSYGPEMRGGTAYCNVVISERPVGSPILQQLHSIIVMNLPSMDKFEASVRPGGLLVINSSLIRKEATRDDIEVVRIPANDIALAAGSGRAANMAALGAFCARTSSVSFDTVKQVVEESFQRKPKVLEINMTALVRGHEEAGKKQ